MKEMLITLNSFIHDLSTGIWFGAIVVLYLLFSKYPTSLAQAPGLGQALAQDLNSLALWSFGIIMLTGVGRLVAYKSYGWTGDIAPGRSKLLMLKHALLGIIFVVGLYLQWYMVKALGGI